MFKHKTVFVVGAGASAEVKFPTGAQLTASIAAELTAFGDLRRPYFISDNRIEEALTRHLGTRDVKLMREFRLKALVIARAMPLATSIDAYIDDHADDAETALLGKLAIAACIIEAERKSKLYVDLANPALDWAWLSEKTWLRPFFDIVRADRSGAPVSDLFVNVSFIVFNYDRCLEQYLVQALMEYFRLPQPEAARIVASITIKHPYGSLGSLDNSGKPTNVFGGYGTSLRLGGENMLDMVRDLKTFTERLIDGAELAAMRGLVDEARTVVFLGFGFHQQNLNLLTGTGQVQTKHVFATMHGVPEPEVQPIKNKIVTMLRTSPTWHDERKECATYLWNYKGLIAQDLP